MNYYNEIKNILIDNAIGRKVREYKSNQKDLESYYNVGKLLDGRRDDLGIPAECMRQIL